MVDTSRTPDGIRARDLASDEVREALRITHARIARACEIASDLELDGTELLAEITTAEAVLWRIFEGDPEYLEGLVHLDAQLRDSP